MNCARYILLAPKSSQNRIIGIHGNRLKISVTSPPVDGKANKQLVAYLVKLLGCTRNDIELVRGTSSRRKTLLIKGVKPENLFALLD